MAQAFILDSDGFVVSRSGGKGPFSAPPGHTAVVVTQAEVEQWRGDDGGFFPNQMPGEDLRKWKYISGALVEQTDTRPTATWSKTDVTVSVGGAPTTVDLTLSVRTDGPIEFTCDERTITGTFVSGVATFTITPRERGGEKGTFIYDRCAGYRMTNALKITVVDNTRPTGAQNELA
jgi:uncharacterized protein YndB with AHSA1/START domain